jgi:hypothetical protein
VAAAPADDGWGLVTSTGIVLVHEGDQIRTKEGAAAEVARGGTDAMQEVRFVFPVEIEVRGGVEPVDAHAVADLALTRLAQGLRST